MRVKAPWIKASWTFNDKYYVIPNMDTLVVGGTCQKFDWNNEISEEDTEEIMNGICQVFPALRGAEVVRQIQYIDCVISRPRSLVTPCLFRGAGECSCGASSLSEQRASSWRNYHTYCAARPQSRERVSK